MKIHGSISQMLGRTRQQTLWPTAKGREFVNTQVVGEQYFRPLSLESFPPLDRIVQNTSIKSAEPIHANFFANSKQQTLEIACPLLGPLGGALKVTNNFGQFTVHSVTPSKTEEVPCSSVTRGAGDTSLEMQAPNGYRISLGPSFEHSDAIHLGISDRDQYHSSVDVSQYEVSSARIEFEGRSGREFLEVSHDCQEKETSVYYFARGEDLRARGGTHQQLLNRISAEFVPSEDGQGMTKCTYETLNLYQTEKVWTRSNQLLLELEKRHPHQASL